MKRYFLIFLVVLLLSSMVNAAEQGLVAYWKFDEGAGTTSSDSSGNNNVGTLQGDASWTSDSILGFAIHFDGSGDYILVPSSSSIDSIRNTNQVRIEASVKLDSLKDGTIISRSGPFLLDIFNSKVRAGLYVGAWVLLEGITSLEVGKWYNLSMTYDGQNLRVFVNGIEDNAVKENSQLSLSFQNVFIGFRENFGQSFHGTIDELKLYNTVNEELCNDNIDNDLDSLVDCDDILDCGGICFAQLQQNVTQLQQQNQQLQQQLSSVQQQTNQNTDRITTIEKVLKEIVDKVRCLLPLSKSCSTHA